MENRHKTTERTPLAGDLLTGVAPVAKFFGFGPVKTKSMAAAGLLPGTFMMGPTLCGLKSQMRAGIIARSRGEE